MNKEETLEQANSLIEMYKAGFYDGYTSWKEIKEDEDYKLLNKLYKLCFNNRFGKKITKALKKDERRLKKHG